MLNSCDRDYLNSLSRVKNILRILFAFGVDDPALTELLGKSSGPGRTSPASAGEKTRLDTANSNIRGDTLQKCMEIIPPHLASELAKHDEIRTRLCKIFASHPSLKHLKNAKRVNSCQQAHLLFISGAPEEKAETTIVPYCCNKRFCPACSREKSRRTLYRVRNKLGPLFDRRRPEIRWITLTIQNPPEGNLEQGIFDLLKAFRRLRRPHEMNGRRGKSYNCWTESVDGYIWNLEISHNNRARTWHPHIHVIYGGDFVFWGDLKRNWVKALSPSGRSGDVKIGEAYVMTPSGKKIAVRDCEMTADALDCMAEVCKYTLQPFESDIPAAAIIELTESIHNKRLFGSGGDWKLPPEQDRNSVPYWAMEGGLARCLEDPDGPWADSSYQKSIILSCQSSHAAWLRIIRNYSVFYWIQFELTQSESHHERNSDA